MAKKEKKWRFRGQTGTRILLFPGPGTWDLPATLPALVPCRSMPSPRPHCLPALEGCPCCLSALPWPSTWDSTKLGMVGQHLLSKQMGEFLRHQSRARHTL